MPQFAIVEAPSPLGLGPTGVEDLATVLLELGLREALSATLVQRVEPPPHDPVRDPETQILNVHGVRAYASRLADRVEALLRRGLFPVVLGGDCTILLGGLLALRRLGRYGLLFLDGHADFYQPEASPTGAVSDMDLALATGRGPAVLTELEGLGPLVRDEDVAVVGYRDAEEAARYGSRDVRDSTIHVVDLAQLRSLGVLATTERAVASILQNGVRGFWIHCDADVLDDGVMPAVDYRLPGGLSVAELAEAIGVAMGSGRAVGLEVTVYNPKLDADRVAGRALLTAVVSGLKAGQEHDGAGLTTP
jgi:arginase